MWLFFPDAAKDIAVVGLNNIFKSINLLFFVGLLVEIYFCFVAFLNYIFSSESLTFFLIYFYIFFKL